MRHSLLRWAMAAGLATGAQAMQAGAMLPAGAYQGGYVCPQGATALTYARQRRYDDMIKILAPATGRKT